MSVCLYEPEKNAVDRSYYKNLSYGEFTNHKDYMSERLTRGIAKEYPRIYICHHLLADLEDVLGVQCRIHYRQDRRTPYAQNKSVTAATTNTRVYWKDLNYGDFAIHTEYLTEIAKRGFDEGHTLTDV